MRKKRPEPVTIPALLPVKTDSAQAVIQPASGVVATAPTTTVTGTPSAHPMASTGSIAEVKPVPLSEPTTAAATKIKARRIEPPLVPPSSAEIKAASAMVQPTQAKPVPPSRLPVAIPIAPEPLRQTEAKAPNQTPAQKTPGVPAQPPAATQNRLAESKPIPPVEVSKTGIPYLSTRMSPSVPVYQDETPKAQTPTIQKQATRNSKAPSIKPGLEPAKSPTESKPVTISGTFSPQAAPAIAPSKPVAQDIPQLSIPAPAAMRTEVAKPLQATPKETKEKDAKPLGGPPGVAAKAPVSPVPLLPRSEAPSEPVSKTAEQSAQTPAPPPPPRPAIPPMYVVMITPELAPAAKVGGLGDVVHGLSRELELRGNSVEIILPKYDCMRYDHIWGLNKAYEYLQVPWFGGTIETTVWFGFVHGRKCFFIDPLSRDNYFSRGVFYGHSDDLMRFAFFCRAALEFMLKTGKHPEVIHCHDWQTALVPVLLYEMYAHLGMRHSRACLTIHNFRHQGVTGDQMLRATGLHRPEYFFHNDRLRDNHNPHALNLLKGGIVYSNFVTTVSPRHAWEARDARQGHGLEPTLHTHHYKFGGVLNGLDYDLFNPETDHAIPSHYNTQSIERKYGNKRALRQRLWLADNEKPIVAFVGRLDPQKGLDLVRHAIFYSLQNGAQFVLLGESPDRAINDYFWALKRHLNDSPDCHLEIGYNAELANLIYAGADLMLVPSLFEPCGLTQLISMRYGTVPVVRSVGGLADTVFDKDYSNRPLHERNGYVFHHPDNAGIESALHRALACYHQFPEHFRHLMLNGMRSDYSWNRPGQHYVNIYDFIRDQ